MRGVGEQQHWGIFHPPVITANSVTGVYHASRKCAPPDRFRQVTITRFQPDPVFLDEKGAQFSFVLQPGAVQRLFMEVHCLEVKPRRRVKPAPVVVPEKLFQKAEKRLPAIRRKSEALTSSIVTANPEYNQVIATALLNQRSLLQQMEYGDVPVAGGPWFVRLFGRDSLLTVIANMPRDPEMARATLHEHAASQAMAYNYRTMAQPGRIVHERSFGEMARTGQVVYRNFYGTVDATGLYGIALGDFAERTRDWNTVRALLPNANAAMKWMLGDANLCGDGLVRYKRPELSPGVPDTDMPHMIDWRDSGNGNTHANGAIMMGAIANSVVQGQAVEALQHIGNLNLRVAIEYRREGNLAAWLEAADTGRQFLHAAGNIQRQIEDRFWDKNLGTYGIALDDDRLGRTRNSTAGELLASGVVCQERAERVAQWLMSPTMNSGWGIRTCDERESFYAANGPKGYHQGTVWPHNNWIIAKGMRNYGLFGHVAKIGEQIFEAAAGGSTPELFGGERRLPGQTKPLIYGNGCPEHTFGNIAQIGLAATTLGMHATPDGLRLHNPVMPDHFRGELIWRDIPVGKGSVDIRLTGYGMGRDVKLETLRSTNGARAWIENGPQRRYGLYERGDHPSLAV